MLAQLASIAPTTAVRGNNDTGSWADALALTKWFEFAGIYVYAIHDLSEIDIDPATAGVQVVVSGHSHKPKIEKRAGIHFINPGSAGPRRFQLPISVAELIVDNGEISSRIVELPIASACVESDAGAKSSWNEIDV